MKQSLKWLLFLLCPLLAVSCSDDKDNEPEIPTKDVTENIIGKWLLSTSDSRNWISYEFTSTSRVNAEIARSGYYGTGTGFYSIENEKISGSYTNDRNQTFYIDWVVSEIKPFEIEVKIYDDNLFIGDAQLFRIVSDLTIETGDPTKPDYRSVCGTNNVSDFKSLDETIVSVDAVSGELTGHKEGSTFVSFKTPNGTAAVKVTATGHVKTFRELLVGTWVYDAPSEKTWERYTYTDNGYVFVQWTALTGSQNLNESAQSMYRVDGETVTFTISLEVGQMNMRMVTEAINNLNWTYSAYDGSHLNGKYTAQRVLASYTLSPEEVKTPGYPGLVGYANIRSYKSHNDAVAKVSDNGTITAVAVGRTYIDVNTDKGSGVIEIVVEGGAIPVAFEECIGKTPSKVHELLGENPYYEDGTMIMYKDFTPDIDMVGISLDSWTGNVRGMTIKYKSSVNTSQVTSILNATFIPYMSQTTETYKAYMDAATVSDATVGVTWNIPELTLVYVNLARDLFTDYSVLIGMTREQVIGKMGKNPETSNEQSQAFFFNDNKGVAMVGVYYTDFVNNYDNVQSVVTMLDGTLDETEVLNYLKKKYPYYPEESSDTDYVFVPDGAEYGVIYTPKDKMVMYISMGTSSKSLSKAGVRARLAKEAISVRL